MNRTVAAAALLAAGLVFSGSATAQSFPVTVVHTLGETTVPSPPKRIVTLGLNDQDFVYALGVAPVAVHEWWGEQPYATWPWAEDERKALGATPRVLKSYEINLEWVAAQTPDLIVAAYYDLDADTYALLSRIAPTVSAPAGFPAWGAPWQVQLKLIGRAVLGTSEDADRIIAEVEAKVASVRAAHPEFEGKRASMADFREGQFTLWNSASQPARFLASLGFVLPETLDRLADDKGWIYLSSEQADLLDLDAIVWPNGKQAEVEALSVYRALPVFKRHRSVWLEGDTATLSAALWFQTPLSLAHAADGIAPLLAAAIAP